MSKRQREEHSLGDVLKQFIDNHRLRKGLDKVAVVDAWNLVMGTAISKYTTQVVLERDTLYVQLSSSVLREELSYGRDKIIRLLNEHLEKQLIKKLVLR